MSNNEDGGLSIPQNLIDKVLEPACCLRYMEVEQRLLHPVDGINIGTVGLPDAEQEEKLVLVAEFAKKWKECQDRPIGVVLHPDLVAEYGLEALATVIEAPLNQ